MHHNQVPHEAFLTVKAPYWDPVPLLQSHAQQVCQKQLGQRIYNGRILGIQMYMHFCTVLWGYPVTVACSQLTLVYVLLSEHFNALVMLTQRMPAQTSVSQKMQDETLLMDQTIFFKFKEAPPLLHF
jgi:hypothetical protein